MAENQVTVRFESVPEERLSYAEIKPFELCEIRSIDEYKALIANGTELFVLDGNGIYVKATTYSQRLNYYKQIYKFLDNIVYYCLDTNDKNGEIQECSDISKIYADYQYFIKNTAFLMSGPVEIFATVDVLYNEVEENGEIIRRARPDVNDMNNELYQTDGEFDISKFDDDVSLFSPFVSELAFNHSQECESNVIIFVENVSKNNNKRGAYFLYTGTNVGQDGEIISDWQEILLGTHTHTNVNALESISSLPEITDGKQRLVVYNPDGTFSTVEIGQLSNSAIPSLPNYITDKINRNNFLESLEEPTEFENKHLDAPLSELKDNYDWITGSNSAAGNCRDLYRTLLKEDVKLYIDNDFKPTFIGEADDMWIELEAFNVNFDTKYEPLKGFINAIDSKTDKNSYLLDLEFQWNVNTGDKIVILYGKNNLPLSKDYDYRVLEGIYPVIGGKNISLEILKNAIPEDELSGKLTVVFFRNANKDDFSLQNAFISGEIDISTINNIIMKEYVSKKFANREQLPKLYLTTNEFGKIEWSNKLLPAQNFYASSKVLSKENLKEDENIVEVIFEDVNYRVGSDFPLIMINELFAFNASIDPTSSKDLRITFPIEADNFHYNFRDLDSSDGEYVEEFKVTLFLVRKDSIGDISDEIAKNYINREDAIAILSHGRIKLSDYITHNEALNFANISHTHSQYAKVDHNHDERYANYHHTHPEISASLASMLAGTIGGTFDRTTANKFLDKAIRSIQDKQKETLEKLISALNVYEKNGKYYLTEDNLLIDNDVLIKSLNEELRECKLQTLPKPVFLKDILESMVLLFKFDEVWAHKVKLESDIPINLKNGPIGGLDEKVAAARHHTYKAGTDIETIFSEILNPRDTLEDVRRILTPSKEFTKIRFYKLNGDEFEYIQNIDELKYPDNDKQFGTVYFSVEPRNAENKACQYTVNGNNKYITLDIRDSVNEYLEKTAGYIPHFKYKNFFKYSDELSIDYDEDKLKDIKISWSNFKIYDNYGLPDDGVWLIQGEQEVGFTQRVFKEFDKDLFLPGDIILHFDQPEFFVLSINKNDLNDYNSLSSKLNNVTPYYDSTTVPVKLSEDNTIAIVFSCPEENLKIFESSVGEITKYFKDNENPLELNYELSYSVFYYTVLADINQMTLKIDINKKRNKRKLPVLEAIEKGSGDIVLEYTKK